MFNLTRKKNEKYPKNDAKRDRIFKPLSGRLKMFHRHFSKSFSPPKICSKKSNIFSPRGSAGVAMLRFSLIKSLQNSRKRRTGKGRKRQIKCGKGQTTYLLHHPCSSPNPCPAYPAWPWPFFLALREGNRKPQSKSFFFWCVFSQHSTSKYHSNTNDGRRV